MGGKNAGGLTQNRSQGIRTSSKMAVYKGMAGGFEAAEFPEYEKLLDDVIAIDEAEANNTIDQLPDDIKNNFEAIKLFDPILNDSSRHHIFFLLWAATYAQDLVETDNDGKPRLDARGNTIPKYPILQGSNLLNWEGVTSVADDFDKVNELIKTEPTLKDKFKPFKPFDDFNASQNK